MKNFEDNISNRPKKKRVGRLKKGEKVEASGYKPVDLVTAYNSIEGMKHKIAKKYKVFCNSSVSYEDLISAANMGIIWAYRDWDANTAKFTTFAYKRIERQIDLYLCEMLPKYKNNVDAKNWLRRKNDESFKILKERGYTKDEEFNNKHGLDGTRTFTKELYNMYTQKVANNLYNSGKNLVINPASNYQSAENDDFNIFDTIKDNSSQEEMELDVKLESLSGFKKEVADMIMDGFTLKEISKRYNMTKADLIKTVDDQGVFND